MSERLFKWLREGRLGPHDDVKWPEVGEWIEAIGPIVDHKGGIRLCRERDLVHWLSAELYEAEADGERGDVEDEIGRGNVIAQKVRLLRQVTTWNDKTARLFAYDCAEHVLPLFEKEYPDDKRPRQAIEVARRYAFDIAVPLYICGSSSRRARRLVRRMQKAKKKQLVAAYKAVWHSIDKAERDAAKALMPLETSASTAAKAAKCITIALKEAIIDGASAKGMETTLINASKAAEFIAFQARHAVFSAAWVAAKDGYVVKDWTEVGNAAREKELEWQTKRLMEYLYPKES